MKSDGERLLRKENLLALKAHKASRAKLERLPVKIFRSSSTTAGELFGNFGNMILNRTIDLFDDAVLLLDHNRLYSACIIARCVMETHAVGMFSQNEMSKCVRAKDIDAAKEKMLKFINSSRLKQEEQKSFKEGKFTSDDYHFTDEALTRMEAETAVSVHVLNSMRYMYQIELSQTNAKESKLEFVYNALSEMVHPSQGSLLHRYAKETHPVETSLGTIDVRVGKKGNCLKGLAFIQQANRLHNDIETLAEELDQIEADGSVY